MSAIWSASSRTVISTSSSEQAPRSIRSPSRPGVATRTSTPRSQRVDLAVVGHAADGGLQRTGRATGRAGVSASATCMASSRVGTRISALGLVRPGPAARGEPGQQRQAERQRLAGAGLATAEHVPAGQRVRDGRGLDRERGGDALAAQRPDQLGGQAELGEGRPVRRLGHGLDSLHSRNGGGLVDRFEDRRERGGISKAGQSAPQRRCQASPRRATMGSATSCQAQEHAHKKRVPCSARTC